MPATARALNTVTALVPQRYLVDRPQLNMCFHSNTLRTFSRAASTLTPPSPHNNR